jgi:hypothetical protein
MATSCHCKQKNSGETTWNWSLKKRGKNAHPDGLFDDGVEVGELLVHPEGDVGGEPLPENT